MGILKSTRGAVGVGLALQGCKEQDPRPSRLVPICPRPEVLGLTGTPRAHLQATPTQHLSNFVA